MNRQHYTDNPLGLPMPGCCCTGCSLGLGHLPLTKRQRRLVERWLEGSLNPNTKSYTRVSHEAERLVALHAEARGMAKARSRCRVENRTPQSSIKLSASVLFIKEANQLQTAQLVIESAFLGWERRGFC